MTSTKNDDYTKGFTGVSLKELCVKNVRRQRNARITPPPWTNQNAACIRSTNEMPMQAHSVNDVMHAHLVRMYSNQIVGSNTGASDVMRDHPPSTNRRSARTRGTDCKVRTQMVLTNQEPPKPGTPAPVRKSRAAAMDRPQLPLSHTRVYAFKLGEIATLTKSSKVTMACQFDANNKIYEEQLAKFRDEHEAYLRRASLQVHVTSPPSELYGHEDAYPVFDENEPAGPSSNKGTVDEEARSDSPPPTPPTTDIPTSRPKITVWHTTTTWGPSPPVSPPRWGWPVYQSAGTTPDSSDCDFMDEDDAEEHFWEEFEKKLDLKMDENRRKKGSKKSKK